MSMYETDLPGRVAQLTDALDAIQDGIVIMDREARIVWANAWMQTHYPECDPFVGRSFPETFGSITGSSFEPPCVRAIATGKSQSFVRAYTDPTGAERWLEVRINRIDGSGDGCTGAVAHFTDVTERRRTEEEREAEAARRRVLVEHSRDGICVVNLAGEVVEANEAYARQLGYTLEEVHKLRVWDWNVDYSPEELLESLKGPEPYQYRFETRHKRRDGSFIDVEVTTSHDEIGGEKLVFSICRDITERRRLERQQRLSQHSVDHANAQLFWLDREGRVRYVSESACGSLGYTKEEMLQMSIGDIDPAASATWEDDWQTLVEQGEFVFETAHYTKSGVAIPVEVSASYVDFEGEECSFVFARDITKRKELEQRLEGEIAWRRMLIRQSRDGIVVLDRGGGVVEANERYAQQLGYALDEVYRLHIWDWDSSFPKPELLRMLAEVDPSGDHFETVHTRKDGSTYNVEISSNGAEIGGQKYIFCVCRDITERKELEQRLEDEIAWRRMLVWQSRDGIVVLNRAGGVVEANEEFARQIGYSLDECQRLHIWEWNPGVPKDLLLQMLAEVGAEGETMETTHTRKDGSAYDVEISSNGVDIGGQKYIFCVCRDITERKELEQRLEDEIAWRRVVMQESHAGMVVMNRAGGVVEANEEFARQIGYSLDECQRLHIWEWNPGVPKDVLLQMLAEVGVAGESIETTHTRKDGSTYEVEISSQGSEIAGEKYVLAVCHDVSERNRIQAERERLIGELQEALAEIRTLRGILPVCSYCHKVRDDEGYWHRVDVYIRDHSEANVSHGICPDCLKKYYGDLSPEED